MKYSPANEIYQCSGNSVCSVFINSKKSVQGGGGHFNSVQDLHKIVKREGLFNITVIPHLYALPHIRPWAYIKGIGKTIFAIFFSSICNKKLFSRQMDASMSKYSILNVISCRCSASAV